MDGILRDDLLPKAAPCDVSVCLLIVKLALVCTVYPSCGADPRLTTCEDNKKTGNSPIPASLHAAYLKAMQNDAGPSYGFVPTAGTSLAMQAQNHRQGLMARLDQDGLHLHSTRDAHTQEVSVKLTSFGCESTPLTMMRAVPRAAKESRRVEYSWPGATEWYANGPLGLEHGFTIEKDLDCTEGKLVFSLAIEGHVKASLVGHDRMARVVVQDKTISEGSRVLVYSDLFALDAEGKELSARLAVFERTVRLEVDTTGARYPITVDPLWTEQATLVGSDSGAFDQFGQSVAVSGDTALVGTGDKNWYKGQAYVFVRSGSGWHEQAKLVASDSSSNDQFGWSVALDGDTAVVGAHFKDIGTNSGQGQAYVFLRTGTHWSEQAKLVAADGAAGDRFGESVSISGNTIVVGAPGKQVGSNIDQGQAYVYVRSGMSWTEQTKLIGSDGTRSNYFGTSVALWQDTAIVGAHAKTVGANGGQGQAYVYTRVGTLWSEQAKLVGSDGAPVDWFGWSVAIHKDTVIVGAYLKNVGTNDAQGQAYVYFRTGASWAEQAKLIASDGAAVDNFGFAVAVKGDTVIVGALEKTVGTNEAQGQAYIFARSGSTWREQGILNAADGTASDYFGGSLSLSEDTAVVSSVLKTVGGNKHQGQVYAFLRATAADGTPCTMADECTSTFCVDGVCCNSSCGGGLPSDCQSCRGNETGRRDGICSTIQKTASYTCRPSNAICDKPELCDGISASCPPDGLYQLADMHLCRPAASCSRDTYCDGLTGRCPPSLCLPPLFWMRTDVPVMHAASINVGEGPPRGAY